MKSALLLLFVVLGVAQGTLFSNIGYQMRFTAWMRKHQKVYTSDEFQAKFEIFKNNADFVHNWNSNPKKSHEVELNQFADLSNAEYQRIYLGTRYELPSTPTFVPASIPADATLNWNDKGAVTPIKDQGQCGSCWSFSAIGSTEGANFKATGNLVSLSEQNLMDCSVKYGNRGCQGGLMTPAFQYIIDNKGIDTEASYPYTAKNGDVCKFSADSVGGTLSSFNYIATGNEDSLLKALLVGPVSVAIDASHQSFQLYKSGVYYEELCSATRLDHGVLAIGYGVDTNSSMEYWIVKNSWGTGWGQDGFLLMSKNRSNNCGIASLASYPVF